MSDRAKRLEQRIESTDVGNGPPSERARTTVFKLIALALLELAAAVRELREPPPAPPWKSDR